MNRRLIFHIGLHKTATTLLQAALFPHLPNIEYRRTGDFNLISQLKSTCNKTILISQEELSGGLSPNRSPGARIRKLKNNLSHIVSIDANTAIIVGFREQRSWMNSAFAEKAKKTVISERKFVDAFSTNELLWCHVLETIEETQLPVFGFLYEEILRWPSVFVEDLCSFIGTQPPLNVEESFTRILNRSPQSVSGRRITRPFFRFSNLLKLLPVRTKPLRDACETAGVTVGVWVDRFAVPSQPIRIDPELSCLLRQDWNDLIDLIGERRGRDFSTLRLRVE